MADTVIRERTLHPVHGILVAAALPLFLGALLSDWAYSSTYEIQWTNFASWLVAGALVFVGFALVWALVDALRPDIGRGRRSWLYVGLLALTFVVGFVNALIHAKDAWAAMPAALILSLICFVLILASLWAAYASHGSDQSAIRREGDDR